MGPAITGSRLQQFSPRTGLGLSICYGIVREHGGRLYAKSDSGKGATFVVEIPIVSEKQIAAEEANSTHIAYSTSEQP